MYAESPAGPREGRQLAVVHPPIRSRRVNPSPAIQEAPLGARNPGWGQGGTGLGGLGEATSFTDRRWYSLPRSGLFRMAYLTAVGLNFGRYAVVTAFI